MRHIILRRYGINNARVWVDGLEIEHITAYKIECDAKGTDKLSVTTFDVRGKWDTQDLVLEFPLRDVTISWEC